MSRDSVDASPLIGPTKTSGFGELLNIINQTISNFSENCSPAFNIISNLIFNDADVFSVKMGTGQNLEQTLKKISTDLPYFDYKNVNESIFLRLATNDPKSKNQILTITKQQLLNAICGHRMAKIEDLVYQLNVCSHPQFILFVEDSLPFIKSYLAEIWYELINSRISFKCHFKMVFISIPSEDDQIEDQLFKIFRNLTHSQGLFYEVIIEDGAKINIPVLVQSFLSKKKRRDRFDFRYFFYSNNSRPIDWLNSITMKPIINISDYEKFGPSPRDWFEVIRILNNSPYKKFLFIIDNANTSQEFINYKRWFIDAILKHNHVLRPTITFLGIYRIIRKTL